MAQTLKSGRSALLVLGGLVLAGGVLAAAYAPYVNLEVGPYISHHTIIDPKTSPLQKGHMVGDYFSVEDIGRNTFAIGEPRYYQQNYAYLIVGETRAFLFDSGSGTRDISPVIRSLTRLPVTVMVSHLHFDHLGGIAPFDHVAMIDVPETRADMKDGLFTPKRYEFSGIADKRVRPSFRIAEWIKPGATIDLGGRVLTVLNTPGHTPSSASVYDPAAKRLFTGDYIYPTTLYAFSPGASMSAYHATAQRLLATIPGDTILWTAHCCRKDGGILAPWLAMKDLREMDNQLVKVKAGEVPHTGFYPRVYPVNDQMTLATGFPWNNP